LERQFKKTFLWGMIYSIALILWGFLLDSPGEILNGLGAIALSQDMLLTDYFVVGGLGATLVNAGVVTIIGLLVIKYSNTPYTGMTIVLIGLLSGFALFGKNSVNVLPIIAGGWLYARYNKEPFSNYVNITLMATTLGPLATYMGLGSAYASLPLGIATGLLIGFCIPPLATHTSGILKGMNLYNVGFASGMFAFLFVSILAAFNDKPETVLIWGEDMNGLFGPVMLIFCVLLIICGFFFCGSPAGTVWSDYRKLMKTSGRAPSDYLKDFGPGPVLVNVGVTGIISTVYILAIGGDLNGPVLGGILTVMGFAATSKHPVNIIPVMAGVALGAGLHHTLDVPGLQIAVLFGTTLAPISGQFGWPFGIFAGFLHSCLVLQTGGATGGMNLYNNGFTAGLIVIIIYPLITKIFKKPE